MNRVTTPTQNLVRATFEDADDFARVGLVYESNNEAHNCMVWDGSAWQVTTIDHGPERYVAYISELNAEVGMVACYAVPAIGLEVGKLESAGLYPRAFPNVERSYINAREFRRDLRVPSPGKLLVISGVMRHLADRWLTDIARPPL